MKALFAAALLALSTPLAAAADPVRDAIGRYVDWRGGAAFQRASGILVRGTVEDERYRGSLERRIEGESMLEHVAIGSAATHRAAVGDQGWTVTLSGQVEGAGEGVAQELARRRLATFDDALGGEHGPVTLQADEVFDGRPVQVLRVAFDTGGLYELLLDPATGALVAERTTEEGVATTTRLDDWRMVEGVRVPFRQVQQAEGEGIVTTTLLTEVDIDPPARPAAFARPASRRIYSFPEARARTEPLGFDLFLGARIYIPAAVNGADTHVLLDSGAEVTVLDKAYAESLGIRPSGMVSAVGVGGRDVAELASGVDIRLGAVELKDITVALMDLQPISTAIGRPLPVILGKEVLNVLTVQLDFQARTITFHDPAQYQPPSDAVVVPVTNVGGLHAIPVSIEGGEPVLMHFDLGNGQPLLVYPNYWRREGMLGDRPSSKTVSGGVGGTRARTVATVRRLSVGGMEVRDVPAIFGDEDNSAFNIGHTFGNVGMPLMSRFELTTDYPRNRMLLRPRPEALAAPFTKDRLGAMAQLKDGGFEILLVAPGSPAEAAGLKAGQSITAVNGRAAADLGVAGFTLLRTAAAGQTLTLSLRDGLVVTLSLKDYY